MPRKYILFALYISIQLLVSQTVNSAVYKWIDENGNVLYGDKPGSDKADEIKIKQAPKQDADSIEQLKKQNKLLDVIQQEREEKIAQEQEEKETNAKQKQKCVELKKELQETKDASLLYEKTDDPDNPRILSDKERQSEENKYERYIEENC